MILFLFLITQSGCASFGRTLKSLVGGSSSSEASAERKSSSKMVRFSEEKNVPYYGKERNYQRMTREQFENQSFINDQKDGSLWIMEGQGSYLFSSNTLRLVGDIVNVKLEGAPKTQLDTKVRVIKNLLAKLEKPKRKPAAVDPNAKAASQIQQDAKPPAPDTPGADAQSGAQATADKDEKEKDDAEGDFNVQTVPTRIVERTVDGNYRVKGAQTFMIGKREYRVIVTGMVRASDINGDVIPADSLLDPKFDVVSLKKEIKL